MNWPLPRIARNRASSSSWSGAYCALTSTSGIFTAPHFSGVEPPQDYVRREAENACNDRVLDVFEVVVELLVARAEPVAEACDHEGPDCRSDERVEAVRPERHPEDARGNRHERAYDRGHPADEDTEVAPLLEPVLGTIES